MSLSFARASLLRAKTAVGSPRIGASELRTQRTSKTVSKPLSSTYSSKRYFFASTLAGSKDRKADFMEGFVAGNKESVRQAYKARQHSPSGAPPQEFKPSKPSTSSGTSDLMEDILNDALPGRTKSTEPEFGNVESYKKHAKEMKLSDLVAAEAEEDRSWKQAEKDGKEDGEWNGFGVDAPVKVPAEVFELNAQAQFSFLKEEYHEAQDFLEQSLSILRSRLGERHNESATIMVSLAQVHEKLKQFDRAEEYLQDAITIRQLTDGPGHTSVAVALNKLAHIQTCKKNFKGAIESSKMASKIIEAARGVNQHETEYYSNHHMEIPEELEHQRRALQTEAGQIANTRGAIQFKSGDKNAAMKDWKHAVSIWSELLPATDSIANPLFAVHRNMVHLHKQAEDEEKAFATAKEFIALLERHQPKSPLLPSAYLYVSQLCEHFQRWNDAWKQAEAAYKSSYEINGSCEETDDLHEAAHLLGLRVRKHLEAGLNLDP